MISVGAIAFRAAQRLRRNRSLELLEAIQQTPYLSTERVLALQMERLTRLLAHAERHVPYYRELFRSLGISSSDIQTMADYGRLPVLTKEIVRERGRDLVREDVPLERLSAHHSGGSTGVPLRFYRDSAYMDASEAGTFRNLSRAGWRPGDMVAFFWGWNEALQRMSRTEFELRQWMRRMYQFDPFQSGPAAMDAWHRRWRTLRPKVALGYASTIARFAEHLENHALEVPPLAGVFTTAETLYPQQREVISRVFRCLVFDCYGSSEVQNIAAECVHGQMHINADFVIVEEETRGEEGGDPTPLLVTSLHNYAMPFLRYRNDDCGRLLPGSLCPCGSGFPLMELRIARVSDSFAFANGAVVHGEYFTHLMYGSEGIDRFQFHQVARDRILLWIVPGAGARENRSAAIRAAVEKVEALAPGQVSVEVRETDQIALSSAGKHRFTRSDVWDAAAPTGEL